MPVEDKILWFEEISQEDTPEVGEKNVSLGEMFSNLTEEGIRIPNGFAITATAYRNFISENDLKGEIKNLLKEININDVETLEKNAKKIRKLIENGELSEDLKQNIKQAFSSLKEKTNQTKLSLAVRSSTTAEGLPEASFAGQQDSFLNITEEKYLLKAIKKAFASIFTDRAISYREKQGFSHLDIACSVGVQQMIDAAEGSSGVMSTIDIESGCNNVILINSSFGFGEYVVKGRVDPDQFYVFKEGLKQGKDAIISSEFGSKEVKLIKGKNRGTKQKRLKKAQRNQLSLESKEVTQLAKWGIKIEEFYGEPQYIEWTKDGETGELYILQSRPETIESKENSQEIETYHLKQTGEKLLEGIAIGDKIGAGNINVIDSISSKKEFSSGEVLVTDMTNPDWEPIMEQAAAIVTEQGGKTSHAAIVARELGVPAILGVENVIEELKQVESATIDCSQGSVGKIYKGILPYEVNKKQLDKIPETTTKVRMNIGNPNQAFSLASQPTDGVGLARLEFILSNKVQIHPLALANYSQLEDKKLVNKIDKITERFENKEEFCIKNLAEGIGKIATAFYPNRTIVRLSDFKSNEYKNLIGGEKFEPDEENPMLGLRGASRYYSDKFKEAFRMECKAIKRAREKWGLDNITVMVPFCRTPQEGEQVLEVMSEFGLSQDDLDIYAMAELPSNVMLAEKFAHLFDGISIGSNDLTQMVLGVDKGSAELKDVYDENNPAVKEMIEQVINVAHRFEIPVSICGQAPSDSLEFTKFLVRSGIDSISLNPDTLIKNKKEIANMEQTVGNTGDKSNSKLLALLIALGILSAILISLGSGCALPSQDQQNKSTELRLSPAEIREQTRQKVLAQQQEKLKEKMLPLTVSSFAEFKLEYPFGWVVKNQKNSIKLSALDSDKFVEITTKEESLTKNTSTFSNFNSKKIKQNQAVTYTKQVSSTTSSQQTEVYVTEILLKKEEDSQSDNSSQTKKLVITSNYSNNSRIIKTLDVNKDSNNKPDEINTTTPEVANQED
jgi:pyruvate,water dikinase